MMNANQDGDKMASSGRQGHVANTLRFDIVAGVFTRGSRMPSHSQLIERFGVSGATIQHAMNQLVRDGFLYTLPRKGTFVVPDPPHLCHYAITFHTQPSQPSWPNFWVALSREAMAIQQAGSRQLSMFYGIHGWSPGSDYSKLVDLARRHQVAGLLFTSSPHSLVGTPLLSEPGIPRVALTSETKYEGVSAVDLEFDSLARQIAYALPAGARRVALITTPSFPNDSLKAILAQYAEGIETRSEWTMAVRVEDAAWARNTAQMLMLADRRRRPNVVIITDDNLVPHATAGIAASGLCVPDDVQVIANTCFPWPTVSAVPVRRIGYDVRLILQTFIELIDTKRAGGDPPPLTMIPAVWEEDMAGLQSNGAAAAESRVVPAT